MQEYWEMISDEHQQKLTILAEKSETDLDTALRNLVNCLQGENSAGFRDSVTAKQIEEMIDTLIV